MLPSAVASSGPARTVRPVASAVAWQSTHLLAWIDLYLETLRADGTAERLYARWFQDMGEPPGEEERP